MKYPFECKNCGHKPDPKEVISNGGDCVKCRDTIIAYTVDTAHFIVNLEGTQEPRGMTLEEVRNVKKACQEMLAKSECVMKEGR